VNFSEWCEQVKFYLSVLDLDWTILKDKPTAIIDKSSEEDKLHYNAWACSNRLSLMLMQMIIANNIKTTILQIESAKEYLQFVGERFRIRDKSFAGSLMAELTTMKIDRSRGMQEHINEMTNIAASLRKKRHLLLGGLIDQSAYLWRKLLGHISKERMERLVRNEVLPKLYFFSDFGLCVNCIKGKQTKHNKKGATRSTQLLEIIHTDVCGPFDVPSFGGERYFITFTDDFSRYGFVYLLKEKSQAVNALEVFVNEVERQLDRKSENCKF